MWMVIEKSIFWTGVRTLIRPRYIKVVKLKETTNTARERNNTHNTMQPVPVSEHNKLNSYISYN